MDAVKKFFGALLLGVAIWIIAPVIPVAVQMLAWAALLIIGAMYSACARSAAAQAPRGMPAFGKASA